MKRIFALILLLVLLVSCSRVPVVQSLDETIEQRFESDKKVISLDELVDGDWDRAWIVDGFSPGVSLPEELTSLEASQEPRLILIKDGNLKIYEVPSSAVLLYPKAFYVTAFEVDPESEFLIDKLDGKYRLLYQEEGEEHCPV